MSKRRVYRGVAPHWRRTALRSKYGRLLCGNVAYVKNLACGDRANIISVKGHHCKSRSTTRDEFNLEGLSGVIDMHDRTDIAGLKTMMRERAC